LERRKRSGEGRAMKSGSRRGVELIHIRFDEHFEY
jgi:hypothetical protein